MSFAGRRVGILAGTLAVIGAPLTALVLTAGPAGAVGPGCQAGNIEVTTNTDAALRAAFTTANGLAGPQTICIDSGVGTITLTGGQLVYSAATTPGLTLEGNGATINGNGASRVINDTTTGLLTLDHVTITNGNAGAGNGAGVDAGGAVTVTNSTISNNTTTGDGGGIDANGDVTVTNSTITGNHADDGAGVDCDVATISGSTISNNVGGADGGGVDADSAVITNSTFSGNSAVEDGGAVDTGGVTATNSTFVSNTAEQDGGAFDAGTVTLVYATVVQNGAPTGANMDTGALTSFASVVAQAQGGGTNCALGVTNSNGFNFSDDASAAVSCKFANATDRVGSSNNPNLGGLANNGGPTQTLLPQAGSALIDGVASGSCQADGAAGITTDQRSLPRPDSVSPACDIGAVEVQGAATTLVITAQFTG